jgi:hypothetical protein
MAKFLKKQHSFRHLMSSTAWYQYLPDISIWLNGRITAMSIFGGGGGAVKRIVSTVYGSQ